MRPPAAASRGLPQSAPELQQERLELDSGKTARTKTSQSEEAAADFGPGGGRPFPTGKQTGPGASAQPLSPGSPRPPLLPPEPSFLRPQAARARPATLPPSEPHCLHLPNRHHVVCLSGRREATIRRWGQSPPLRAQPGPPEPSNSSHRGRSGDNRAGKEKIKRGVEGRASDGPTFPGAEEAVLRAAATRRRRDWAQLGARPPEEERGAQRPGPGGRPVSMMRGAGSRRGAAGRLPGPAARPGPSGRISGLGLIITRPSPGRGTPRLAGPRRGGWAVMRPGCAPPPGTPLEEVTGRGRLRSRSAQPASNSASGLRLCAADRTHQRPRRPRLTPGNQASSGGTRAKPGGASSGGPREHRQPPGGHSSEQWAWLMLPPQNLRTVTC
ncbi:translation initiation factor IF-2-like [Sciurus carolinensis]|uniref:translation initiation factor IF-2-like n=1 Tax=Sciurus carolinensis TaxID=30640 RepID=UPI001FB56DC7|nr:translation initiation factor IF-2-like [Sciurus carolinensis]